MVNLEANEIQSAGLPWPRSRYADWVTDHPLPFALAIQAALLFYRLDLLKPCGDEWFNITTVPPAAESTSFFGRTRSLYASLFRAGHFSIQIPWPASQLTKDACDVGPMVLAGNGAPGSAVAGQIGTAGAANGSDAVGTLALPAALLADGEVLHVGIYQLLEMCQSQD